MNYKNLKFLIKLNFIILHLLSYLYYIYKKKISLKIRLY